MLSDGAAPPVRGDGIRLVSSQISVTSVNSLDSTYWLNLQHFVLLEEFALENRAVHPASFAHMDMA